MSEQPEQGKSSVVQGRRRPKVKTLGGVDIELMHSREKDLYEHARDKYLSEYSFTMANDLRTLDRLLLMEVQIARIQWWTAAGRDYDDVDLEPKDEVELRRSQKELAAQIIELQNTLGLTKSQREKQTVDSVGGYIQQLQVAAKEHGINRERQLGKALELTKELFALKGAFLRSNETERRKLGFEGPMDIITWIDEYMEPQFNEIDEYFRANQARFYRRSL